MRITKLILSLFITMGLITAFACVNIQAAVPKPTLAKAVELSQGVSETFPLVSNFWTIKSHKSKSSNKSVASVTALEIGRSIRITGNKAGIATITTTVKAQYGRKTKTFKLKTKVVVTTYDMIIPYEDLYHDNMHDVVFSKHTNYVAHVIASSSKAADEMSTKARTIYSTPDEMFVWDNVAGDQYPEQIKSVTSYYTNNDVYQQYSTYTGDDSMYHVWFAMSDAEIEKLPARKRWLPRKNDAIIYEEGYGETTIRTVRADDRLIITTQHTVPYSNAFSSNKVEERYVVDADTHDVYETYSYYITDDAKILYGSCTYEYDTENPVDTKILLDYVKRTKDISLITKPQKITVVYGPDESYSTEYNEDAGGFILEIKAGYKLYLDEECTVPMTEIPSIGMVRLYAAK